MQKTLLALSILSFAAAASAAPDSQETPLHPIKDGRYTVTTGYEHGNQKDNDGGKASSDVFTLRGRADIPLAQQHAVRAELSYAHQSYDSKYNGLTLIDGGKADNIDLYAGYLYSPSGFKQGGLRVGVPAEFLNDSVTPGVRHAVQEALKRFEALGATLVPVSLPHTELAIPAYYVIAPAEASSNLARYDGVRYGHRSEDASDLKSLYMNSRAEGFGAEVKRRIMIGTFVLSHGYYDAYYRKAQQLRRMIADDFARVFGEVDVIAGPVTPETAWPIGQQKDDPVRNYLADIFTLPASLAGLLAGRLPAKTVAGRASMASCGTTWVGRASG